MIFSVQWENLMNTATGAYGQQSENNPREVRREDSQSGCSPLSPSKGGTSQTSSEVSSESERVYGKAGAWRVLSPTFFGGILSLEREKASEALRNAEECIQWYAREKERALEWIAKVDALQAELNAEVGSNHEIE